MVQSNSNQKCSWLNFTEKFHQNTYVTHSFYFIPSAYIHIYFVQRYQKGIKYEKKMGIENSRERMKKTRNEEEKKNAHSSKHNEK